MSSFLSSTVFLFFISFAFIEGTSLQENSSYVVRDDSVARKESTCEWPGKFLLSEQPALSDSERLDEWQKKVQPQAFRDWMQCTGPVSKKVATRRLRKMKKVFENSGGLEELETRSNCDKSEFLALFDMKSNATQIRHAASCIVKGMKKPVSRFSVTVRVDETCERNKRNMIRRTRNIFIAAAAATAAAGVCCAAYTPLGPACCATLPTLVAGDALAFAELVSARQFECPKCSDEPTARMVSGHGNYGVPNQYRADGGSRDWHEGTPRM